MPQPSSDSVTTPKTSLPNGEGERLQEAQGRLLELRELFSSQAWNLLKGEVESLYLWYGEAMDRATDHDDMVRAQASRRLLKHLFGGMLEQAAIAKVRTPEPFGQPYMAYDAYTGEETSQ